MHSSVLRATDFQVVVEGDETPHGRFFAEVGKTTRIGVVSPEGLDATGASLLMMAFVTAFYDRYREGGDEFFAYPDYFVFQMQSPLVDYGMLDFWPNHKMVLVEPGELPEAVTDRAVNVLLIPEGFHLGESATNVTAESARRTISRGFCYAPDGRVIKPTLRLTCAEEPILSWMGRAFESVEEESRVARERVSIDDASEGSTVTQHFREMTLEETLDRLGCCENGGKE